MAEEYGIYYMETSAKTGAMVEDAFMKLTMMLSSQ